MAAETARRAMPPDWSRAKPIASGMRATRANDPHPAPSTPARTARWAQSPQSQFQKEIPEISAAERPLRRPRIPAGTSTILSGKPPRAGRIAVLQPRRDARQRVPPRAWFAGPTWPDSFSSGDPFIPEPVMMASPRRSHFPRDDGAEAAADQRGSHIDVNNEAGDGRERRDHMHGDRKMAEPCRNRFHEPESGSRKQQQERAVKHQPEKRLLALIKTADGRKFLVLILNVIFHRFGPGTV